jgi:hypothetical protein
VIPDAIVPRHEGTQQILDREVNEWWAKLPLAQRLGIHLAATTAGVRS